MEENKYFGKCKVSLSGEGLKLKEAGAGLLCLISLVIFLHCNQSECLVCDCEGWAHSTLPKILFSKVFAQGILRQPLYKPGVFWFFLTSWVITDDVGFAIPVPEQQGCIPGSWEDVTIPSNVGLRTGQTGHNIPMAKHYLHQFTWNTANWLFKNYPLILRQIKYVIKYFRNIFFIQKIKKFKIEL